MTGEKPRGRETWGRGENADAPQVMLLASVARVILALVSPGDFSHQ